MQYPYTPQKTDMEWDDHVVEGIDYGPGGIPVVRRTTDRGGQEHNYRRQDNNPSSIPPSIQSDYRAMPFSPQEMRNPLYQHDTASMTSISSDESGHYQQITGDDELPPTPPQRKITERRNMQEPKKRQKQSNLKAAYAYATPATSGESKNSDRYNRNSSRREKKINKKNQKNKKSVRIESYHSRQHAPSGYDDHEHDAMAEFDRRGQGRPSLVSPPAIKDDDEDWEKVREREKLTCCSIVINVIYNAILFVVIVASSAGLYMYEWIESSEEQMKSAGIYVDQKVPGFKSVSCGLITYCVDAAGAVSECTLPWPEYGGMFYGILGAPYLYWKISSGLIFGGVCCIGIAWLYTFFACFGCFNTKVQKFMTSLVVFGGLCQVGALIVFAYSFGDLAVSECKNPGPNSTATSNPPCTEWYATLPSETIEGVGNAACRICPTAVGPFTMASSCEFGWGAKIAAGACVLSLLASSCGKKVRARESRVKGLMSRRNLLGERQQSTV